MGELPVIAAQTPDIYYKSGYWNDYPAVASEINRRVSGHPDRSYVRRFRQLTGNRRFARALFLNCGNGWVEREYYELGLIDTAVGVDFSEELLGIARTAALGLPIRYVRMDINQDELPNERFDLVVNFSAGHHIARVDRVLRSLLQRMTSDGWFLNYDYIGPHRNQYPYEQWSAVWELNESLPPEARQNLRYPHLPTMLVTDPSEAVHSELFVETFKRYFSLREVRYAGGGLAYPILTFNEALAALSEQQRGEVISRVLEADFHFTADKPHLALFAYFCGTPQHAVLDDEVMLDRWTRDEDERERAASAAGGIYYPRTLLQAMSYQIDQ
jgi:SAM-dependent methyltransferase